MTKIIMTSLIATAGLMTPEPSTVMKGYLSRYDEGPTLATIAYRQAVGDLPPDISHYDGVIAVADCGLIGREALLMTEGNWYRVIVFDCAGSDGTAEWMAQNRIIAEMGYSLAKEVGALGRGGIPGQVWVL